MSSPNPELLAEEMGSHADQPEPQPHHSLHGPEELTFYLEQTLRNMRPDTKAWANDTLTYIHNHLLPSVDLTDPSRLRNLLREYMAVFDSLLFSGSLISKAVGHRVTLTIRPLDRNRLGQTTSNMKGGLLDTEIAISPILCSRTVSDSRRQQLITKYLSTLVHEMLHAYFNIFCDSWGMSNVKYLGATGHGACWQRAAHEIEDFLRQELGVDLCLEIVNSWFHELAHFKPEIIPQFQQICSGEITWELERMFG